MSAQIGLIGKKLTMTQVFEADGSLVGVTAIELGPCVVVQKKTVERDGYTALQIGFDDKPARKVKRAEAGHFAKANVTPKRKVLEFRVSGEVVAGTELGAVLKADSFQPGDVVDVVGVSVGRGFAGVMKRHGFRGAKATHGVHEYFRHGGSLGTNMTPGRVMKGRKMPGHMGDEIVTVQNVKVVRVFAEDNIIFVKGPVPGARNSYVTVRTASKSR